jgi:hypothetical protein
MARSFTDGEGREWVLFLDINLARAIRKNLSFDILNVMDGAGLQRLANDVELLVNVIYQLCKKQAQERKVTEEQFGHALVGDVLGDACDELMEAISDFFPKRKREMLQKILEASRKFEQDAMETIDDKLDTKLAELKEQLKSGSGSLESKPSSDTTADT